MMIPFTRYVNSTANCSANLIDESMNSNSNKVIDETAKKPQLNWCSGGWDSFQNAVSKLTTKNGSRNLKYHPCFHFSRTVGSWAYEYSSIEWRAKNIALFSMRKSMSISSYLLLFVLNSNIIIYHLPLSCYLPINFSISIVAQISCNDIIQIYIFNWQNSM